jgi:dipeptidyl aminopeptidase/acylaminoacyl peptidase
LDGINSNPGLTRYGEKRFSLSVCCQTWPFSGGWVAWTGPAAKIADDAGAERLFVFPRGESRIGHHFSAGFAHDFRFGLPARLAQPGGSRKLAGQAKYPHCCAAIMKPTALFILWCLIATGMEAEPSSIAGNIPLESFFGLPSVHSPLLSPDGRKIAFLFPLDGRMALGLFDRASGESRLVLRGTDESLYSFFWKGNDRLVFEADFQGNESFFVGATDLSGKKVIRIVETQGQNYLGGSSGGIVDELESDPDHIMVEGILRSTAPRPGEPSIADLPLSLDYTVAKVNVGNRAFSPVYTYGSEHTRSIEVDNAGVVRLRSRVDHGKELVWEHRENDGKSWHEIARHPFNGYAETWRPLRFAADNTILWLISREEHDCGALHAYNTLTQQRGPALFVPPEGEIEDIITTHDRTRLLGVAYESERRHYHWVDEERARLQASLENIFKGAEVRVASQSDDEKVKLVWVGHDREPGVYFVLDQNTGSLTQFKRTREIDPALLSPRRPITYTARDGLVIHGYLTLPHGAEGRRVPLIIHPHGGPFGVRDSSGFDADAQFLANRGYAVLQPNYRGSGGYGREFVNKGRFQWGRAMQDDLTDAVKWAVAEGIADPARVAIYGASYGGYAALVGVTLTPELYCCAINYVGAADLEITFKDRGDDAYLLSNDFSYQREWVGPTAEWRAATSPVNFVERIRVPTLHAYGEKDPRVKIDHWTRLEAQLKKHGKTYESIEQKRQGHGFRDEKASVGFYGSLESFLARHLAPLPVGTVRLGEIKTVELPARN